MAKKLFDISLKNLGLLLVLLTIVSGCSQGKVDPFDIQTGATRAEIKDFMYGNKAKKEALKKAGVGSEIPKFSSIPQVSKIIAIPSLPKESADKLISFSVTEQVPLKDVLIELAKAAKLDLDLDPGISGGVIVNAKNRPLAEVLDRVCEMGALRYTLLNNRLYVERDLPFAKNYLVDFLADGNLWGDVASNIGALISNGGPSGGAGSSSVVSSNRLANIMTVFASEKNQAKVASYIESVRKNASAQVLIEAKVVEVTLNDNYRTGIDWTWLRNGSEITQTAGGAVDKTNNPLTFIIPSTNIFGGSISANINALEEFGTVKAISSPRINALNNQKASLNFTKKLIYFTNDSSSNSTTTSGTTNTQSTVTSTKHEEPTGTELTITPSIDLVNGEVTLNVNPKIIIKSDKAIQTVLIPDASGTVQTFTNEIPVINTRELTTVAKIKSGSVLVIGGVMSEDTSNTDKGLPFLSRIPVFGNLFKSSTKTASVNETVIFIKATIIGTGDGVSKYDRKVHDTFTSSARPFFDPK